MDRVLLAGFGILGTVFLLPLLPVAVLTWMGLFALRTRRRRVRGLALMACLLPAVVALLWAWKGALASPGVEWREAPAVWTGALGGYPAVQQRAMVWAVQAVRDGAAFPWQDYGLAVWPYAVAGGPLAAAIASLWFGSTAIPGEEEAERSALIIRDAADLRAAQVAWAVAQVAGRGVLSLLVAEPGTGKGWLLWALARAMQDGGTFFGLETHRLPILWLTEEGTSFVSTRDRFGVGRGLVYAMHRHEVAGWPWSALVKEARRRAWRLGCGLVVVDTVRSWYPEAERDPKAAYAMMDTLRKELAVPGLGVIVSHHGTKAGGKFGRASAGTNALVGASDLLIELERVSDERTDPRRRLVTSRRYEPLDLLGELRDHRYVLLPDRAQKAATRAGVQAAVHRGALSPARTQACARCGAPAAEWHHPSYEAGAELTVEPLCTTCHQQETADPSATVRETVATIRTAGPAGMTTAAFRAALGIKDAAASKRLNDAERAGLLIRSGGGGRHGPQVWHVVDHRRAHASRRTLPPIAPPPEPPIAPPPEHPIAPPGAVPVRTSSVTARQHHTP